MLNNSRNGRNPAYDTGPIPISALSTEEIKLIAEVNGLLKRLQDISRSSNRKWESSKEMFWANPERERRNNVILLEGVRGVGKTSFLLTLIRGWINSNEYENNDQDMYGFKDMNQVVRTLQPIDFDPLPPDLPIYSWIIQAFNPIVRKLSSDDCTRFLEDESPRHEDDSLMGLYWNLHRSATIGWTTGLLKQSAGKDAEEYFLWQEEQQVNWQRLRGKWQRFIDKLLCELEITNRIDSSEKFPQGGLMILPIDDLDLQVVRTRELLLSLRVLRHERLVYILTGELKNTDLALNTSFYRDFIRDIPVMTEDLMDKIREYSDNLGQSLREKTIPSSQVFSIKGIGIDEAMDWVPPNHGIRSEDGSNQSLGEILGRMWERLGYESHTISDFIKGNDLIQDRLERLDQFDLTLPFRRLQNFCDKWRDRHEEDVLEGIKEFLQIVIEHPEEDELIVGIIGGGRNGTK